MEYTKDIILNVKYGQVCKTIKKSNVFEKILNIIRSHRFITTVISIALLLIFLDFILISSFVNVLSNI